MSRTIAFLRAINVGGHTVTMPELIRVFGSLGLAHVETFIASGNVILDTPARGAATLERRIERKLEDALGYEVATFLRTDAEVAALAARPAFDATVLRTATTHAIGFLAAPLSAAQVKALLALAGEDHQFRAVGREVHWVSRLRQGESKFNNMMFERTVKAKITFRSANTLARLAAKYPPAPAGSKRGRGRA